VFIIENLEQGVMVTKKINFLDWGGKPFFSELNNSVFRMEQKSFHIIQLTK
jgi:hypothetical protein